MMGSSDNEKKPSEENTSYKETWADDVSGKLAQERQLSAPAREIPAP